MAIERSLEWQKISKQRTSRLFEILITGAPRDNPMNVSGKSLEREREREREIEEMAGKSTGKSTDKMKQAMMPNLNWKTKKLRKGPSGSLNVTVMLRNKAVSKKEGAKKADTKILDIAFRDNLWKQFNSDYVIFAVFKNRIYFKGAEPMIGYKLTAKSTTGHIQATLRKEEIAEFEPFAEYGNFSLRYDDYMEMYYIDIERQATDDYTFASVPVENNLSVTDSSAPLAKEPQKKKPGRKPKPKVKDIKATVKEVKNEQEVPV